MRPLTAPAFTAQYAFRCTTAGTSSTEPTWGSATGDGNTVTSGGATFTNVSGRSGYGWSAAFGNLLTIGSNFGNRAVSGDRIFVSSDHAESYASGNAQYFFGQAVGNGLVQVISVNRAGSVPPVAADQTSGATITVTAGQLWLDTVCAVYWQGVNFIMASANHIFFNNSNAKQQYYRNCSFYLNTTNTGAHLCSVNTARITWDNTTVQFGATGQTVGAFSAMFQLDWINTPSAIQGAIIPTTLFTTASTGYELIVACRGLDLSALNTAILTGSNNIWSAILLDSCRIAPGVTRYSSTFPASASTADEIELVNCYDGTSILSERHKSAGDLTTSRTTTLVGGAQDDVGLFSHQMVSSSRSDFLTMTLDSFWMDAENAFTGGSRTATVEIISSASLNNTDISLQLEYLGTSGSSLASFTSSLPNALTASSAVPTSAAVWNSPPATPVAQHLQVTFTPQQLGRLRGIVRLGKPSTTCWINPQITVS